jgi:hypothetical protein
VEDNEMLTGPFTEKKVKEAIFEMKPNNALGPNEFTTEFYQQFWEVIKYDLMALFKEFHDGTLPPFHLKYGVIMLLPKQKVSTNIKLLWPICLLNVSFKIFTKVVVRRLTKVVEK